MENASFTIQKDFDFPVYNSYEEMQVRADVLECIQKGKIERPTLLHQHCLPALLSENELFISSPPATGKTALLNIAIHHLLQRNFINLQFIVLEGKEYLVKETFQKMLNFAFDWNVRYCVSDKSTKFKEDYAPFTKCQIAITSIFKLLGLLKNTRRTYETLKFVIIDAVHCEDVRLPTVIDLIKQKAPQAKFWYLTNGTEIPEPTSNILQNYMPMILKAIVINDHVDVTWVNHFYVQIENIKERFEMIKKIIDQAGDIQTVLFCTTDEIIEDFRVKLESYFPKVLFSDQKPQASEKILSDFGKGLFKVFICFNKQFFARRVKSDKPTYVIITSPVDKKNYEVLTRRAGMKNNDRIFTFVNNNDEIAMVEEVAGSFGINLQKWPRAND